MTRSNVTKIVRGNYIVEGWTEKNDIGETVTKYRVIRKGIAVKGWSKEGSHISEKDLEAFLDDYRRLME